MPLVNGRAIDQLVQTLRPGLVVPGEAGLEAALDQTRDIFSCGAPTVLYQGAFREGSLAAVVDVLRAKDDAFELVGMKSSTSVKDEHLPDVAFQALITRASANSARTCPHRARQQSVRLAKARRIRRAARRGLCHGANSHNAARDHQERCGLARRDGSSLRP